MKNFLTILFCLLALSSFSQEHVDPTYTRPYFQGNVKVKDTLGVDDLLRFSNDASEQYTAAIEDSLHGLPSNYRVVAGVIRNTGPGWELISDAQHFPLNIDSVTNNTVSISIHYSSLGATEIVSLVASPDETFASQYTFGASVGTSVSNIRIKRLATQSKVLVTHTGNGVFTLANQNGSDFTGLSYTYSSITGLLDITHSYTEGVITVFDLGGNTHIMSGQNSEAYLRTKLKFYNLDGTQQTLANPEVLRFLLQRQTVINTTVDPNNLISANGNIWIFGIVKIE